MTEVEATPAECPLAESDLTEAVQKHAGPQAPAPLKMMTARGMAPMPPRDLVTAQFVLSFDADDKVRAAASQSMAELDARLANAVLSDSHLHPAVLGGLAVALVGNDAYLEKLLLNPKTPASAFVTVAGQCSEAMCEIVANNQARLLEEPEIARSLSANDNALKSTVDRVIDFLVRGGIILDGLHSFDEAFLRLNGEERVKAAQNVKVDESFLDERHRERQFIEDEGDEDGGEERKKRLEEVLATATMAQKVKYATQGNKAMRSALMRDTNRLVALAAVSSPMVTEPEIVTAAQSRTVHADAVAYIARDKKNNWSRLYQVKVALVNNPKAPLNEALRLVASLNPKDLKALARSRNVSGGVRNRATQLAKTRGR